MYFAAENPVDPFDFRSDKYIDTPEPVPRGELKRQYKRNINTHDIHWRNLKLLTKFLNNTGTIKTRFANR